MIKPYYQDEFSTIYWGDCRDILPELAKVDLVLSDPPYGQNLAEWDKIPNFGKWLNTWWSKVLKISDQQIVFFCSDNIPHYEKLGNIFFRSIWVRYGGQRGGNNSKVPPTDHEFFYWFGNAKYIPFMIKNDYAEKDSRLNEKKVHGSVFNIPNLVGKKTEKENHPTQKPVKLIKQIIEQVECDFILDPFMGVGTTLRAAKDLNKKHCTGIEISEKYCEIAVKRLSQEVLKL